MTLNKFLNKTLDAAKQSALQIYEDDYSRIRSIIQNEGDEDEEQNRGGEQREEKKKHFAENTDEGVVFERSTKDVSHKRTDRGDFHSKLEAIREYAARQTDEDIDGNDRNPLESSGKETKSDISDQLYSRKDLRMKNKDGKKSSPEAAGNAPSDTGPQLYDKPVTKLPDDIDSHPDSQSRQTGGRSIRERLNRLESLSRFSGHDFSSHPIFEKLFERGVPEKIINEWYRSIMLEGIDPDKKESLFRSKLLNLIRDLLAGSAPGTPNKTLLFCGRSGSGKTRLVMKLCRQAMKDNKIAVVSYRPGKGGGETILAPFCKSNDISHYRITKLHDIDYYRQEWDACDHVLIDTPSFRDRPGNNLIGSVREFKKALPREGGTETHFVFNSASKEGGFNLPAEVEADHIALTHFDRREKWGEPVALLAKSNCLIRYISSGPSIYGSFIPYEPKVLAQKLMN